jgi:hypothetical protein
MGRALVGEVIAYLGSDACDLTAAERLTLLAVACRAHDDTRQAWQGGDSDWNIAKIVGVRMPDVFTRLAGRGMEIRVQLGVDGRGRAVYACRGHQTSYRLPALPGVPTTVADPVVNGSAGAGATANGYATADPLSVDNVSQNQNGYVPADPLPVDNRGNGYATADPKAGKGTPQRTPNKRERDSSSERSALADLGATPDEERKIISIVKANNPKIKNIGAYIDTMHRNGDLAPLLADIREPQQRAAARSVAEVFMSKARHMPPCVHELPGGNQVHPSTGAPLCPMCRKGLPASTQQQPTVRPKTAAIQPLPAEQAHASSAPTPESVQTVTGSLGVTELELADLGICVKCAKTGHFVAAIDEQHGSHCHEHAPTQLETAQ